MSAAFAYCINCLRDIGPFDDNDAEGRMRQEQLDAHWNEFPMCHGYQFRGRMEDKSPINPYAPKRLTINLEKLRAAATFDEKQRTSCADSAWKCTAMLIAENGMMLTATDHGADREAARTYALEKLAATITSLVDAVREVSDEEIA